MYFLILHSIFLPSELIQPVDLRANILSDGVWSFKDESPESEGIATLSVPESRRRKGAKIEIWGGHTKRTTEERGK